eukprot:g1316.t1
MGNDHDHDQGQDEEQDQEQEQEREQEQLQQQETIPRLAVHTRSQDWSPGMRRRRREPRGSPRRRGKGLPAAGKIRTGYFFEESVNEENYVHEGKQQRETSYEDVRRRVSMTPRTSMRIDSVLQSEGIAFSRSTIDEWTSDRDFDRGTAFESLCMLYEVKMKELFACSPRVDRYGFPARSRTALVCGIFASLATDMGRYGPLLRILSSSFMDAIFVKGIHFDENGLSPVRNLGGQTTWAELCRRQRDELSVLKARVAQLEEQQERHRARAALHRAWIRRSVQRWRGTLLRACFDRWCIVRRLREEMRAKIGAFLARSFLKRGRMRLATHFQLWRMFTATSKREQEDIDRALDGEEAGDGGATAAAGGASPDHSLQIQRLAREVAALRTQLEDLREAATAHASEGIGFGSLLHTEAGSTVLEPSQLTHKIREVLQKSMVHAETQTPGGGLPGGAPLAQPKKAKKKKKKQVKVKAAMPLAKTLDTVAAIYEKKVKADAVDDEAGNERDTLIEFCADFFLQMYGSVMKSAKHAQFKHSVLAWQAKSIRVRWFGTLVGWLPPKGTHGKDCSTPYTTAAIDFFLKALACVFSADSIEERMDDDPCMIRLDDAIRAAHTSLASTSSPQCKAMLEGFRGQAKAVGKKSNVLLLEFDSTFDSLLREFYRQHLLEEGEEEEALPLLDKGENEAAKEEFYQ